MKLSKMSKGVLKYGLISAVCVLVLKLIMDYFNDRNNNNVQAKLDNVNAKINKLKSERAKNSESSKLNKIQKDLNKAELERNHYLRILHVKNNEYRNNRYNKLENRLAARIRNNDRKRLNALSNKINNLMEDDTTTQPPATDAPVANNAPVTDAPVANNAPVTDAPVVNNAPVTDAPVVNNAPVTDAPTPTEPEGVDATNGFMDYSYF